MSIQLFLLFLFICTNSILHDVVVAVAAVRVIQADELKEKTSAGGSGDVFWLSVLGEVYDVSLGVDYYKGPGGYAIFTGRDASICFVSGIFTEEEAMKPVTELKDEQLHGIETWRQFYEEEDRYPFVGVLEGSFYDAAGRPTELLEQTRAIIVVQATRAAQKEEERKARVAAKRAKRAADKAAAAAAEKKSEL